MKIWTYLRKSRRTEIVEGFKFRVWFFSNINLKHVLCRLVAFILVLCMMEWQICNLDEKIEKLHHLNLELGITISINIKYFILCPSSLSKQFYYLHQTCRTEIMFIFWVFHPSLFAFGLFTLAKTVGPDSNSELYLKFKDLNPIGPSPYIGIYVNAWYKRNATSYHQKLSSKVVHLNMSASVQTRRKRFPILIVLQNAYIWYIPRCSY